MSHALRSTRRRFTCALIVAGLIAVLPAGAELQAQEVTLRAAGGALVPEPIYVVDGEIVSRAVAQAIVPDGVASISVLRGAAIRNLLGEASAGGMIFITTHAGAAAGLGAIPEGLQALIAEDSPRGLVATRVTSNETVMVRGAGGTGDGTSPLVVLDGVIVDFAALQQLQPSGIARIQILKGPAAAALYGEAAERGVILVTSQRTGTL
jgi:TonB-dependent SusC/RagA subfamily outer membrane receptor